MSPEQVERRERNFPSTYPLRLHTDVKKKKLLRGEYSEPCIRTSLSLELSKRSFPIYIPLTGAPKCDKKNTTIERRAKQEKFPFLHKKNNRPRLSQMCKKKTLLRGERRGVLQMAVALHLSIAFQQSI